MAFFLGIFGIGINLGTILAFIQAGKLPFTVQMAVPAQTVTPKNKASAERLHADMRNTIKTSKVQNNPDHPPQKLNPTIYFPGCSPPPVDLHTQPCHPVPAARCSRSTPPLRCARTSFIKHHSPSFQHSQLMRACLERLHVHTNRFAEGEGRDGEKAGKEMDPLRLVSDPGRSPDCCRHYDGDCGDGLRAEE
jgi:hypothetical protein